MLVHFPVSGETHACFSLSAVLSIMHPTKALLIGTFIESTLYGELLPGHTVLEGEPSLSSRPRRPFHPPNFALMLFATSPGVNSVIFVSTMGVLFIERNINYWIAIICLASFCSSTMHVVAVFTILRDALTAQPDPLVALFMPVKSNLLRVMVSISLVVNVSELRD